MLNIGWGTEVAHFWLPVIAAGFSFVVPLVMLRRASAYCWRRLRPGELRPWPSELLALGVTLVPGACLVLDTTNVAGGVLLGAVMLISGLLGHLLSRYDLGRKESSASYILAVTLLLPILFAFTSFLLLFLVLVLSTPAGTVAALFILIVVVALRHLPNRLLVRF